MPLSIKILTRSPKTAYVSHIAGRMTALPICSGRFDIIRIEAAEDLPCQIAE
jgi:hypothetical protein